MLILGRLTCSQESVHYDAKDSNCWERNTPDLSRVWKKCDCIYLKILWMPLISSPVLATGLNPRKKLPLRPVRIRHHSRHFATQSSHFVDRAGWQAKMASIEIWIPWRNAHRPLKGFCWFPLAFLGSRALYWNVQVSQERIHQQDPPRRQTDH